MSDKNPTPPPTAKQDSQIEKSQQHLNEAKTDLDDAQKVLDKTNAKKSEIEKEIEKLKRQLDDKFVQILEKSEIKTEDILETKEDDDGLSFNRSVTIKAPINIAFLKYWGKRDVNLNLPLNSSLSATLDPNILCSETTVETSRYLLRDEISINGEEFVPVNPKSRIGTILKELRYMARREHGRVKIDEKSVDENGKEVTKISFSENRLPMSFFSQKLRVKSHNNFPTAAGMASSASGMAALTYAIAHLYNLTANYKEKVAKLSTIARQGSGSAVRSMLGGFVEWQKGEDPEGTDSIAVPFEQFHHWPDLRFLICVAGEEKKKVSSTAAMIKSQKTSTLLEHRTGKVCDLIMTHMKKAIKSRNFPMLGELIMRDSNQLHAICQDTFPPINYLNETSRKIIDMVHRYNGQTAKKCLAYSFDAGPNAVLITTQEHLDDICTLVKKHFAADDVDDEDFFHENSMPFYTGNPIELEGDKDKKPFEGIKGGVKYCIVTQIGSGPVVTFDAFEVVDTREGNKTEEKTT